jgi:L-asparaginase II
VNQGFGEVLVEIVRAGIVESEHKGHFALLKSDGSVQASAGEIDAVIFPRSSVKIMQASAMVRNGLKLTQEQLAIVQASHSGSQAHFDLIESILHGAGLDVSYFRNATDRPLGVAENAAWGEKAPTQLAQNCSGKHAGMLATCVINGWDLASYLDPAHPLQVAIFNEMQTLGGIPIDLVTADGCGAPLFGMTTLSLATAIHRVTVSKDPVHQEVIAAARAYPVMVAGIARTTTQMMQRVPGLFMKDGAEAVEVFSMSDGRTCAFKIADGGARPFAAINKAVFAAWGIDAGIELPAIMGGSRVVGEVRTTLEF